MKISDIFHFAAIHFLPERHSAMILMYIPFNYPYTELVPTSDAKNSAVLPFWLTHEFFFYKTIVFRSLKQKKNN